MRSESSEDLRKRVPGGGGSNISPNVIPVQPDWLGPSSLK